MRDSPRVLITGVSRGLGRAAAHGFASLGYRVVGGARTEREVASLAEGLGEGHLLGRIDVTDEGSVAEFAAKAFDHFGAPDLLLNNAGVIHEPSPLWEISEGVFEEVVSVNVSGTARVVRHVLPAMIARGSGVVVNFSSGWGRTTSPGVAPYCASKWAIEGLTLALSSELPDGLAAVAFNPGIIDTEMLRLCFGEEAANFPDADSWAKTAVPFLAALGPKDNGKALSCPGF